MEKAKSVGVPKGSTFDDFTSEQNLPYSFGVEIELVLLPNKEKIASIAKPGSALHKSYATVLSTPPNSIKETANWAICVTDILQEVITDPSMSFIYAKSKGASVLKKSGEYYRKWSVIEDPSIESVPGECKSRDPRNTDSYIHEATALRTIKGPWRSLLRYFTLGNPTGTVRSRCCSIQFQPFSRSSSLAFRLRDQRPHLSNGAAPMFMSVNSHQAQVPLTMLRG